MGQQEISKDFLDKIKRALSEKLILDQRRAELPSSKFQLNQLLCQVTNSLRVWRADQVDLFAGYSLLGLSCVLFCLIVNALRIL